MMNENITRKMNRRSMIRKEEIRNKRENQKFIDFFWGDRMKIAIKHRRKKKKLCIYDAKKIHNNRKVLHVHDVKIFVFCFGFQENISF